MSSKKVKEEGKSKMQIRRVKAKTSQNQENLFRQIVIAIESIFGLSDHSYEERSVFIGLTSICFLFISTLTVEISLDLFFANFTFTISVHCIRMYVRMVIVLLLGIELFLFVVFKRCQLFLWFMLFTVYCFANFIHFYSNQGGILAGTYLFSSSVLTSFALFYGNTFNKIFFTVLFYVNFLVGFVIDSIINNFPEWCEVQHGKDQLTLFWDVVSRLYIIPFLCSMYAIGILIYYKNTLNKYNKLMDNVGKSIFFLEFNGNKSIQKLKSKRKANSSIFERLLQGFIYNLEIYKKYLPDQLKVVKEEDFNQIFEFNNSKSNVIGKLVRIFSKGRSQMKSNKIHSVNYDKQDNNSSEPSSNSTFSSSSTYDSYKFSETSKESRETKSKKKIESERMLQTGLISNEGKDVAVLFISIDNFSEEIEGKDLEEVSSIMSKYIDIVSDLVYSHRGIINEIMQNTILCSFNLSLFNTEPVKKACFCAYDIRETISTDLGLSVTSVVMKTERNLAGTIQTVYKSKFLLVDEKIRYTFRLSRMQFLNGLILCDSEVREAMKYYFNTKQVEALEREKKKPISIFKLEKSDESTSKKEWLYILGEDASVNENRVSLEEGWKEYLNKNFKKSKELAIAYFTKSGDDDYKFLIKKLKEKCKDLTF